MRRGSKLLGQVDSFAEGVLQGWSCERTPFNRYEAVQIELSDGKDVFLRASSCIYREDVRAAGFGSGCFGFYITLTAALSRLREFKGLVLREQSSGIVLKGGDLIADSKIDHSRSLKIHRLHKYMQDAELQRLIESAERVSKQVGVEGAVSLLYASILGRMPEKEVLHNYKDGQEVGERYWSVFAKEMFYSDEAMARRGRLGTL